MLPTQLERDTLLTPADKSEAETLIKAIEPLTVSLELAVNEPGAKVFVDDKLVFNGKMIGVPISRDRASESTAD